MDPATMHYRHCSFLSIGGFPPISRGFFDPPEISTNLWSKWTSM